MAGRRKGTGMNRARRFLFDYIKDIKSGREAWVSNRLIKASFPNIDTQPARLFHFLKECGFTGCYQYTIERSLVLLKK